MGQGEYRYANGDRYVGHWNEHVRQGLGTYTYGMLRMQFVGWWDEDKRTNDGQLTVFDDNEELHSTTLHSINRLTYF